MPPPTRSGRGVRYRARARARVTAPSLRGASRARDWARFHRLAWRGSIVRVSTTVAADVPLPRVPAGRLDVFQGLAPATTAVTYRLILVGGLVRASGAGLGCPDWPKCFGLWIPPASAAELPPEFDPSQFNQMLMWT